MSTLRELFTVRPSPFHDRAAEHCLTNAWTREGALTLVEVYSALEEEYWALAADAGLMDLSARCAYRLKGAEAEAALDHLLATRIGDMQPGQCRPVLWCIDAGFIAGEGLLLREAPDAFVLVTEEPAASWIADSIEGFACGFGDMSAGMARLGLAGPAALAVLDATGLSSAAQVERGHFIVGNLRGLPIGLARTQDTGFELWTTDAEARVLWDRLMRAGQPFALKPAGTRARTIHRLERGEARQGVDFMSALRANAWGDAVMPDAVGLSARVDLGGRSGFVGWQALAAARPSKRRLVRLCADTAEPVGQAIIAGGDQEPLGYIVSSAYSPGQGASLAFGWIESEVPAAGLLLFLPPDSRSRGKLRRVACRVLT
jgi:glycine cleavage system aminomethyltransferase T